MAPLWMGFNCLKARASLLFTTKFPELSGYAHGLLNINFKTCIKFIQNSSLSWDISFLTQSETIGR